MKKLNLNFLFDFVHIDKIIHFLKRIQTKQINYLFVFYVGIFLMIKYVGRDLILKDRLSE